MIDDWAAVFKAAISANTKARTYDLDEAAAAAKSGLPSYYAQVYLEGRAIDQPTRLDGSFLPAGYRLSTRVSAKTITNARLLEQRIRDTFAPPNQITLDGQPVTVRYEQGGGGFDQPDADGYYTALTDWIFVR